ncbi:Conserved membrane protein of uncharacterised function [Mycobacterium tuberculosis]|nr:Conserved membrane protein of uncharacterised function [Mycobacterium tuberculosis]CMO10523.1 Conserved membrane protein of uncharacterised function [Mycobacterium tuberculosis]
MTEPAAATTTNASDEPATGAEQAVDTAATPQTPEPQPIRSTWWIRHYTFTGTAMGLVFVWFSMTPSLLPRGPLFQGLVSGICGAFGYGLESSPSGWSATCARTIPARRHHAGRGRR